MQVRPVAHRQTALASEMLLPLKQDETAVAHDNALFTAGPAGLRALELSGETRFVAPGPLESLGSSPQGLLACTRQELLRLDAGSGEVLERARLPERAFLEKTRFFPGHLAVGKTLIALGGDLASPRWIRRLPGAVLGLEAEGDALVVLTSRSYPREELQLLSRQGEPGRRIEDYRADSLTRDEQGRLWWLEGTRAARLDGSVELGVRGRRLHPRSDGSFLVEHERGLVLFDAAGKRVRRFSLPGYLRQFSWEGDRGLAVVEQDGVHRLEELDLRPRRRWADWLGWGGQRSLHRQREGFLAVPGPGESVYRGDRTGADPAAPERLKAAVARRFSLPHPDRTWGARVPAALPQPAPETRRSEPVGEGVSLLDGAVRVPRNFLHAGRAGCAPLCSHFTHALAWKEGESMSVATAASDGSVQLWRGTDEPVTYQLGVQPTALWLSERGELVAEGEQSRLVVRAGAGAEGPAQEPGSACASS